MHVSRQVGPPKVRLHLCHEIEHPILKRKLRHGGWANLDAAHFDPACIRSPGYGNALLRTINTADLPRGGAIASLLSVLPPPQPTSRMVKSFSTQTCPKPQSVALEWR